MARYYIDFNSTNASPTGTKASYNYLLDRVMQFLLSNSDTVFFTNSPQTAVSFGLPYIIKREQKGTEQDSQFDHFLQNIADSFIKKEQTSLKYLVEQKQGTIYTRYYYRLTPTLKDTFARTTLFWQQPDSNGFYTLEDPTFLHHNTIVGHVISHESIVFLELDTATYTSLTSQGIILQSV